MVFPSWLQPLQDFATGTQWFRWFKLTCLWEDDELDFTECGIPCETPKVWTHEDIKWVELFAKDGFAEDWGLKNGICPGQPFLVELKNPVYSSHEDPDVTYPYSIVHRMPRTEEHALKSWTKLKARQKHASKKYGAMSKRREQLALKPKNLHIVASAWGLSLEGYYDLGQGKKSTILVHTNLIYPRTPETDSAAFLRLVKGFIKRYPYKPLSIVQLCEGSGLPPLHRLARIALELSCQRNSNRQDLLL